MTPDPVLAAALAAVVAAVGGLLVPRVIAALPEPEEDPGPEAVSGPDAVSEPEAVSGPEADTESVAATDLGSELDADVRPIAPPVPPKVAYVDLAAKPYLGLGCAVAAGLLAAAMGASRGLRPDLPVWVFLAVLGVALGYIDWRTRLLPARLVAPSYGVVAVLLVVAGLVDWSAGGREALLRAVICWVAVFAVFFALWFVYPRGLGYGDVRLSGVLGMALGWLGVPAVLVGIYAGFLLGAVIGGVLAIAKVVDRKGYPFGPFMLVGAFLGVLHAGGDLLLWR